MASRSRDPLVWIDCEMTGLDPETERIISICCFITDADLNLLEANGFESIIHTDSGVLENMNQWCRETHGASGLSEAAIKSQITAEEASRSLLQYIEHHVPRKGSGLLAGNSVHADKTFLSKQPWKSVLDHLSYRILDVSSIKEGARRWCSDEVLDMVPVKKCLHQAREDILESIEEARFYRRCLFSK